MDEKRTRTNSSGSSVKEKSDSKKYNFYRKPSIKKKAPEVKQTLTSYKRMLKANPLLKYEIEGKDVSILNKPLQNSNKNTQNNLEGTSNNFLHEQKQSLQPDFMTGKTLITKVQRSQSLKNPPKLLLRPAKKEITSTSGNNKQLIYRSTACSTNRYKHNDIVFNAPTSRFTCSTPLENNGGTETHTRKNGTTNKTVKRHDKLRCLTQDNFVSSSNNNPTISNHRDSQKKNTRIRRSLSAQHFERKTKTRGTTKISQEDCSSRVELTQSLEDFSKLKLSTVNQYISPIAEGSQETSMIFKTPSAYERRSIAKFTPKSVLSTRRSLYRPVTPLPSLNDLQKRLNDWLLKRGKSPSSFHHLKCFGIPEETETKEEVDEENKENIEVNQDLDKGSYEDLKIDVQSCSLGSEPKDDKILISNESIECIAKAALEDLHKLIQDGYPGPQCEGWLELIRQKYQKLEEEPQYWECRAAIEQSRGNISNAVQCYRTAIVQGAEIQSVDESLDILLKKFSLLNISTKDIGNEKSVKERARIVIDARNVFKSSIIQFAVQERKLKKNGKITDNEKKFVATPVRRSTRLSRSNYTSTPGVKICSSLQELDTSNRDMMDFKTNKALV